MTHAVPVFVDTAPDSFLLDVSKVEAAITEKTKAILPVHIAGYPADLDALVDIANRHNLGIVEDCAQATRCGMAWTGGSAVGGILDASVSSPRKTFALVKVALS